MTGELKRQLPFNARYEIAKILLKDNPSQRAEIVNWMVTP
jgi:hypothetical protein